MNRRGGLPWRTLVLGLAAGRREHALGLREKRMAPQDQQLAEPEPGVERLGSFAQRDRLPERVPGFVESAEPLGLEGLVDEVVEHHISRRPLDSSSLGCMPGVGAHPPALIKGCLRVSTTDLIGGRE